MAVVSLMRSRTLGNSPTALQNNLEEMHSEAWLKKSIHYLNDCKRFQKGAARLAGMQNLVFEEPPPFRNPPTAKWFLTAHVKFLFEQLDVMKASLTSVYGSVLKIDSTKKIVKKIQGKHAGKQLF